MWRQFAFGVILGVFVGLGLGVEVEVSLNPQTAGFFLKPMFRGQEVFSRNALERPLVVTDSSGEVRVKAQYGQFKAEAVVPPTLLHHVAGDRGGSGHIVTQDIDISAHLVSRTVTQERPLVSVLFHASQLPSADHNKIKSARYLDRVEEWCVQMHVQQNELELTAVCVLGSRDNVCVADLTVPLDWWHVTHTTSAEVYYSVFQMDKSRSCSSPVLDPSVSPGGRADPLSQPLKRFVSAVTFSHGQVTYQELKEDQHILVYIPQKSFYPGSSFRVPIKLQAESDLQIFVIKVKARHGIRIADAVPKDSSRWSTKLELNHKNKGAMVTAAVVNQQTYSKTDRVQEIFEFVFEVEEDVTGDDRGRLSFTLAYEMTTEKQEMYGSVENRVVARLDIQQDNTLAIVPVIKSTDLINMAMLTGKMVSQPMRIYSISQGGKVADITSTTTCHSGHEDVLKVVESCNLVYLDGTETKSSASVSVIAKYGRHNVFLFFRVWVPEQPEIQLSDNRLSPIKGWKVPIEQSANRKTRGVAYGLLSPQELFHEEGLRKEDLDSTCQIRYQQSQVEIYTQFVIHDSHDKKQYFGHRKAMFRVTDELLGRLRVADTHVAMLKNNIVQGLRTGLTEVQVVNQTGRVIAAQEVRVTQSKVELEKLEVDVVTNLSISIQRVPQMEGVLQAKIQRETQLTRTYQEGILDIKLCFDDGTTTPLHQVSPSDYFLEADTMNNHVVAFGPQVAPDMPRVIALGSGKGELLKLTLDLGDACQKKKVRSLAIKDVYININFDGDAPQRDASIYNRPSFLPPDIKKDPGIYLSDPGPREKNGDDGRYDDKDMRSQDDLSYAKAVDPGGINPNHEAQQQLVFDPNGMTPLEIGMYVLLGIFCVAIVVFMVNCVIFVSRYKRKRCEKVTKDPISSANDWVWIGRATLERNAINTTCSHALMSEADFNGNHNNSQLLSPPDPSGTRPQNPAAESSNRNSVISTYKGSECSIRITANPLPNDPEHTDDDVIEEDSTSAAPSSPREPPHHCAPAPEESHDYDSLRSLGLAAATDGPGARSSCPGAIQRRLEPLTLSSDSEDQCSLGRDYFSGKGDEDKAKAKDSSDINKPGPSKPANHKRRPETLACDSDDLGIGACGTDKAALRKQRREALHVALAETIKAQQDSANGNLASGGDISEAEWDYEVMGLTYDQLMDYFDNLKESTA